MRLPNFRDIENGDSFYFICIYTISSSRLNNSYKKDKMKGKI